MGLKSPVRDIRTINRLLGGAEAEARRKGESLPGAEHLLLAALALPEGSARRAFERVGADPDRLADAIAAQHADALAAIGIEAPDGLCARRGSRRRGRRSRRLPQQRVRQERVPGGFRAGPVEAVVPTRRRPCRGSGRRDGARHRGARVTRHGR